MKILSIQSHVAYGHVGNSAAVFPLQRRGHDVLAVLTVNFSNHTGYSSVRGPVIAATDVQAVIEGMDAIGALEDVDVVLSGYQGSADISHVILDAVARVRAHNPGVVYVADPVMGNRDRGVYVAEGIVPLMREQVVPAADIVTPNQFELALLTGLETSTLDQTLEAVEALRAHGPSTVLVTSVFTEGEPEETLSLIAADEHGAYRVRTPLLSGKITGSGDVTAALFTSHYVPTRDTKTALEATTASIFDLIEATKAANAPELLVVQAQDVFVSPTSRFEAERIA